MNPIGTLVSVPIISLLVLASAVNTGAPVSTYLAKADTVSCVDTLRATDTVASVVKVSVRHQDTSATLPPDFEGLFAQEFRSRFTPPTHLPLSVMFGDPPCDRDKNVCSGATPLVHVVAYAIVSSDGTIPHLAVISPSLNDELADSVRSALSSMGKANMVPFFQLEKSIPLAIIVNSEENPDSIPPVRRLFRAKLPRYAVQFQHAQMSDKNARPKYPVAASRAAVGDTLKFQFTILPDGRVAPQSVDVLRAHYREFLQTMGESLSNAVFKPARLGACPVAEWVTQTYQFAMRPGIRP
jgi:hypothetical protein